MRSFCWSLGLVAVLLPPAACARFSEPPLNKENNGELSIKERARTHWAFRPIRRPAVPTVKDASWVRNPIDGFILARLEAAGLKPTSPASRRTLLRRAFLDLVGLPPNLEEQERFLANLSPAAWSRLVERLLAHPGYGVRWGRHWLDVARYADTNGYERDGDKPHAWRYRDYVIASFNRDLPYDRFILEQMAGDELPDGDARAQIATTFLRLGTWDDEPANDAVDRYDQLDDVLGVTASAFLAQTVRCARCHDHKFEPVSQKDYYRLLAVFEPLKRPQRGRADLDRHVGTRAELDDYDRAFAAYQAELAVLDRQIDEIRGRTRERVLSDPKRFPPAIAAAFRLAPKQRSAQQKVLVRKYQDRLENDMLAVLTSKERGKLDTLTRFRAALERRRPAEPPRAYIWYEDGPKAPQTRLFRRGNPQFPGRAVQPGLPAVLAPAPLAGPKPLERSTGRRLWLARWIASGDNPLTARVIANRVWQWHFGKGIVATPGDFGLAGEPPSHPELLDWLAGELIRSGWSLKHLHRLILHSSTYQTSSARDGPDSARKLALFGRWRQRRLEAESVRDSILAVSGQIDNTMSGPGVYPALPAAVLASQSRPGLGWGKSGERESARRSIYVFAKRSLALPELELLDAPDSTSPCEARPMSTTAPQALTFLNGSFTNEQARHLASRLVREAGDDPARQVRLAFALALCRPPAAQEEKACLSFLDRQTRQIETDNRGLSKSAARRRALASFCLVVFNTSEFFYPG
jgi:hypothetical protein